MPASHPATRYARLLERAHVLLTTSAQEWVAPAQACALTGLSYHQLSTRADKGRLTTHRSGPAGKRRYRREELIALVADRDEPLTVFDALLRKAAESGLRMNEAEYRADEAAERNGAGNAGDCWRLLTCAHREDPGDIALSAWHSGSPLAAINYLHGQRSALHSRRALHDNLGLTERTLWAPRLRMSSYERFQLHSLRLQENAGFDVRVLPPDGRAPLELAGPLPELVVYPNRVIYLPQRTTRGRDNGAVRLHEPETARALHEQLTVLREKSTIGLMSFARPHLS